MKLVHRLHRLLCVLALVLILPTAAFAQEWRSIDGTGNNLADPNLGAKFTRLMRVAPVDYADGISASNRGHVASPREISNIVVAQPEVGTNQLGLNDMFWVWGQFIDHDISLTEPAFPLEAENIPVPAGDPFFDPQGTGTQVLPFNRSIYDPASGLSAADPREQLNELTTWIDASMVYGSDQERADFLRTFRKGKLKTSDGRLLPFNGSLPNSGPPLPISFVAGDKRVNENVPLIAIHTLLVREHNRLARQIRNADPSLDDEGIYQRARDLVAAQIQAITYNEWLPAMLGPDALSPYQGYDASVDPSVANVFSTAAFRFGHTMLSSLIPRLDANLQTIPEGNLTLAEAFFAPDRILFEGGIEPVLRGVSSQVAQELDPFIIDDVRNFLFGAPGFGGFDLASLNIMRGRDHGLPGYNQVRVAYGLPAVSSFAEISSDPMVQSRLAQAYASVDDIDPWVGLLAEDKRPGAAVSETTFRIVKDQFERLRDGDRFWYQLRFSGEDLAWIENQTLSKMIRRNSPITAGEVPRRSFFAP